MASFSHHDCDLPGEHATVGKLLQDREDAEVKAIDSLARYKFAMFGYWAGIWVHLNQIIGDKKASPFKHLVMAARSAPDYVEAVLEIEAKRHRRG